MLKLTQLKWCYSFRLKKKIYIKSNYITAQIELKITFCISHHKNSLKGYAFSLARRPRKTLKMIFRFQKIASSMFPKVANSMEQINFATKGLFGTWLQCTSPISIYVYFLSEWVSLLSNSRKKLKSKTE